MEEPEFDLTRRKVLGSIGAIGAASAGAGLGTSALFSDTESFEENTITAGTLDLKVDWQQTYDGPDGLVPVNAYPDHDGDGLQSTADGNEYDLQNPGPIDLACEDLASGDELPEDVFGDQDTLVSLGDVKPGDSGEITFSFNLCDNPGYVWLNGGLVSESENGINEAEAESPDEDGEPVVNGDGNVESSLWPLAALAGVPALGRNDGDGDGDRAGSEADIEANSRRSAVRKGAGAAGAAAGGLALASQSAAAEEKGSPPDPDGNLDVNTSNSNLNVTVGELGSSGFSYNGEGTLFFEEYGFRDGDSGTHIESSQLPSGNITDPFPSSVPAGDTATSTISYPVPTSGGTTVDLEVNRNVTLDATEPILRVEYEVSNPSGSGATFDDLRLSQYVDYDIGGISNNVGRYFFDPETNCEFIYQETTGSDIFAGFTAEETSVNHHFSTYSDGVSNFSSDDPTFDNDEVWPPQDPNDSDLETEDVELTFEWSLGSLAPGETTSFRTSFVYNQTGLEEFQQQICQESPGAPTTGDVELTDRVRARVWYDDGDNALQNDEEVFLEGSLREVLSELASGNGVPLDGDQGDDFDELGGDPTAESRGCYSTGTHYLGFEWWIPTEVGNEIQSDTATFDLGFYAEQCRHNDGAGPTDD
uniref:SipW-dependent-type signal peptide-containing protein n=1 Tax=Halobellus rufus TaxID=1448860 RepID=UPI0006793DF0|nr:SipW-dependent-type signal peptide-containing protein [Halobellus rufus]